MLKKIYVQIDSFTTAVYRQGSTGNPRIEKHKLRIQEMSNIPLKGIKVIFYS